LDALDYAKRSSALPIEIDPVAIDRFARPMREQLVSGDAARKAYLSAVVDAIVVSDNTIRIIGSNENIRSTLAPDGQPTPTVQTANSYVIEITIQIQPVEGSASRVCFRQD
jgi:hypothetical protein